jgi:hypothetical protein
MAPLLSLAVVTFIFLLDFSQATYSASASTNLAVYWVCVHMIQRVSILICCRDKDQISNAYFISVSNQRSILFLLALSIISLLRGMASQVTILETNAMVGHTSTLDQETILLIISFKPNVQTS